MNMWLQWLLAMTVKSRGRPALTMADVARTPFRVLPSDIDFLGHMNNGRYPSYMDLARVDMMNRAGVSAALSAAGIYPVVGMSSMVYRKSLDLFQAFDIETAVLGVDERAVYIVQRFVVDGEVYARGVVQGRFIERGVGTARVARVLEVLEAAGIDTAMPELPEQVAEWARLNALPPSRAAHRSEWDGRVPR